MSNQPVQLFSDTETAFAYKSDAELKKARFLFNMMGMPSLVKLATRFTPLAIEWNLPVRGLLRKTIFKQFVGGENLQEVSAVVDKLNDFNVQVIMDYGAEGKESEDDFEKVTLEFIKLLEFASGKSNIPFIGIKITGFARFALLEKLNDCIKFDPSIQVDTTVLSISELQEWQQVLLRLDRICNKAAACKVGVLIDAEESWIQNTIDALALQAMANYNQGFCAVYNTYQMYRHDRLSFLESNLAWAGTNKLILGAKVVRGAYMEKERARAIAMNYESPIQVDKQSSDRDFDAAILLALQNLDHCSIIIASHNEESAAMATSVVEKQGVSIQHPHIHFSQLYGMSDHLTFNLAKKGCNASKYLPYGPLEDVVPYLMRRAQENSAVSGETGRELQLINKEINRRLGKQ
ncbi:proline dehydrogenase [Chitinophaga caeni]|uniref:Proline dehydrogenase n=1 Tax=Chitinophaga caeni TaxID=2029983 RepID=A0A291QW82_9BACT|nr:proline dehydrogenase family protein [Chitinophaga caeni]ATL48142.1 proline dehydrogenase [Chitinophaga caeni]